MTHNFTLPHDPLTPLDTSTRPTPRTIRLLRQELYANACSVRSTMGGGNHGHLGMLMPNEEYVLISNGGIPYVAPDGPPQVPTYAGTAAVVAIMQANYNQQVKSYEEHQDLSNHIKAMMLQAIPKVYTGTLAHAQLGYANVTPKTILAHLLSKYGEITERDLADNTNLIKAPWDPETPIEHVFENGIFCREFATEGEDPISDATYMRILVGIFEQSGVLEKAVEEWEKKPKADKTLDNGIMHFMAANEHRLTKLAKSSKDVLVANTALEEMKALLANTQAILDNHTTNDNKPAGKGRRPTLEGFGYCWSHGVCQHRGRECKYPKDGHKHDATIFNRLGGHDGITINKQRQRRGRNGREQIDTPPENN